VLPFESLLLPRYFEINLASLSTNVAITGIFAGIVYACASFAQVAIGWLIDRISPRLVLFWISIGQVIFSAIPLRLKKGGLIDKIKIEDKVNLLSKNLRIKLNEQQEKICKSINTKLNTFNNFLISGVTGSGKTEVYIELTKKVIRNGGQVLIIVPEINLTPQTIDRFRKYMSSDIQPYHSSMTEKDKMIDEAEEAYGKFLDALKCDWRNDPNSMETPKRVAKAYVNDLWSGRYTAMSPITSFPSDGYDGIIIERNIPLTSMCSHHHQTIGGVVHIGYISGEGGQVIGLSKLNRIVELFGRRGAIQEQLTSAIHNAVSKITEGNKGVIVTIVGTHNCVSCRGVKHQGAAMVTTKASGVFRENNNLARKEFFDSLKINNGGHNI